MLEEIGAKRWETAPPQAGKIAWFDEGGRKVAEGRYRVILSYGPGVEYTMAWNIGIYNQVGIPTVGKEYDEGPGKVDGADKADAWKRAIAVGEKAGAEFVYLCTWLWVAVNDFKVVGEENDKGKEGSANAPVKRKEKPSRKSSK